MAIFTVDLTNSELTVVPNVAIGTGPALLGTPRLFVFHFFYDLYIYNFSSQEVHILLNLP